MKIRFLMPVSILAVSLFSCAEAASFVAKAPVRNAYQENTSLTNSLIEYAKSRTPVLEESSPDYVYSPLADYCAGLIEKGFKRNSSYFNEFRSVVETLNLNYDSFSLSCQGAFASNIEIEKSVQEAMNQSYVTTFVGNDSAVKNGLREFYGRDIPVAYDSASLSIVDVVDYFKEPLKVEGYEFFQEPEGAKQYDSLLTYSELGYEVDDLFSKVRIQIQETVLSILVPEDGYEFSPDSLLTWNGVEGKARIKLPEFSVSKSATFNDELGRPYVAQDSTFAFSRFGAVAKSAHRNTDVLAMDDYDFQLSVSKPFYFALSFHDVPLFIGHVSHI